jgi:hypothetical protein
MNEIYFSVGALGIGASAYAYLAWQRAKYSKAFDAAFTAVLDTVTNNDTDISGQFLRDANSNLRLHNLRLKAELQGSEAENRRLEGDIDNLRALLADIAAQETDGANATVKRMAALARAGVAK